MSPVPPRLPRRPARPRLPAPNRRWLIVNALLATAVINVIVNAAIAWLGVSGQGAVPFWGTPLVETSIVWNLVGTLFLLPLITCVLATSAIRRDLRRGSLEPLGLPRSTRHRLGALPSTRPARGAVLGAIAVITLAPPLILVLALAGPSELGKEQFIACQTAFAVALGIFVTPLVALCAMADPPPGDG